VGQVCFGGEGGGGVGGILLLCLDVSFGLVFMEGI
jgi:hypothetical protein